jgi:pimeloyl-ACP methyl ester carboxylesterase
MAASGRTKAALASVINLSTLLALLQLEDLVELHEDPHYDQGFEKSTEAFETADGVTLRLKRYIREGGQPVLLVHGFFANGSCFDLPHKDHNLALYLAERGYDVWVASFRGCGREPYRCGINDWNHSVDHLAALDAPSLVDGVSRATGKKPAWIGHSMGGMVLYMYLQGALIEADRSSFRVVCDPELARKRNASILGGITIGSPPAFYFGGRDWLEYVTSLPLFKAFSGWLIQGFRWTNGFFPRLGGRGVPEFTGAFPRAARIIAAKSPLASSFYNVRNVHPDVGYSFFKLAGDSVSSRMTTQILGFTQDPDLKDYNREYNYSENMKRITAPLFFISGSEDFTGPENIRVHGYEQVSSKLKRFKLYPGYGHTDLVMGKKVVEEVYPVIVSWLDELQKHAAAGKALSE